jgi:MFS family permease
MVPSVLASSAELFPRRKDRWLVAGLVLLAAAVSVAELATAHLFAALILPGTPRATSDVVLPAVAFLAAFALLRLVHYAQSLYRLTVFERAFARDERMRGPDSWRWASAMELVGVLTQLARLVAITAAIAVLAPPFAVVDLVVALVVLEIIGAHYRTQGDVQRSFRTRQKQHDGPGAAEKVRTRVRAGERGALFANLGVMLLLGLLVAMTVGGQIAPGTAFVVFLAVRMQGQIYTAVSTGLMRLARAQAHCE